MPFLQLRRMHIGCRYLRPHINGWRLKRWVDTKSQCCGLVDATITMTRDFHTLPWKFHATVDALPPSIPNVIRSSPVPYIYKNVSMTPYVLSSPESSPIVEASHQASTTMAAPSSNLSPAQIQAQLRILLNGPAGVPPPRVSPNFVDPSNLTDFVILTTILGLLVTTFALIIRIYTKAFLIRSITLDDCWSPSVSTICGVHADMSQMLSWFPLWVPSILDFLPTNPNSTARRGCVDRLNHPDRPPWRRCPYLEPEAENILQDALRMESIKVRSNRALLTMTQVHWYLDHRLCLYGLLRQALHSSTISSNFRPNSQSEHAFVHRDSCLYLELLRVLSSLCRLPDRHVQTERKILGPINQVRSLLRLFRFVPGQWNFQCGIRLRNIDPAHVSSLEPQSVPTKEDRDYGNLWHRLLVSTH